MINQSNKHVDPISPKEEQLIIDVQILFYIQIVLKKEMVKLK